jgi:SAM-dependent methyltransferase
LEQLERTKLARLVAAGVYKECNMLFNLVFRDFTADSSKEIAKRNVQRQGDTPIDTLSAKVYGEVEFFSFANLLERVKVAPGDRFYDLGHGTGKAMVAASLLFGDKLSHIEGVELLEDLYDLSKTTIQSYTSHIARPSSSEPSSSAAENPFYSRMQCPLVAHQGDFLEEPWVAAWTSADIVFANSTCFDDDLMRRIAVLADRMKPGARMITFTRHLPSDAFEIIDRVNLGMSWGAATCYVHVRKDLMT